MTVWIIGLCCVFSLMIPANFSLSDKRCVQLKNLATTTQFVLPKIFDSTYHLFFDQLDERDICEIADAKSLEELSRLIQDPDLMTTKHIYNLFAADIKAQGGASKIRERYQTITAALRYLQEWEFPQFPLRISDDVAVRDLLQQAVDVIGPGFLLDLAFIDFAVDLFLLDSSEKLDTLALALSESDSIEEFYTTMRWNNLEGWQVNLLDNLLISALKDLEGYEILSIDGMDFIQILEDNDFLNLNYKSQTPHNELFSPKCFRLGAKFFGIKEFLTNILGERDRKMANILIGEYLYMDFYNQADWHNLACWLAGVTSLDDIEKEFQFPKSMYLQTYHMIKEYYHDWYGGASGISKVIKTADILLPALQKAGFPDFPLNATYEEIFLTIGYLMTDVGPDFPNYILSLEMKPDLPLITDPEWMAKVWKEASSLLDVVEKLGLVDKDMNLDGRGSTLVELFALYGIAIQTDSWEDLVAFGRAVAFIIDDWDKLGLLELE